MPGIAGIVDFNQDSASIDKQIRRMVKILNHTSPAEEDVYISDHAALGAVHLRVYPFHDLVAEDTNTAIAFWGYLWDQEDLKKRTGLNFQNMEDVSVGNLLLTLYNKEGIDGLCNLNGRFVIAIWNKREKVLNLINDRYGFCKLFYWVTPQRILFASEYKAIVWHEDFPKKIDQQGLADFMTLGYSTGDRTLFENIKLLPPASVATFRSDGLWCSCYLFQCFLAQIKGIIPGGCGVDFPVSMRHFPMRLIRVDPFPLLPQLESIDQGAPFHRNGVVVTPGSPHTHG